MLRDLINLAGGPTRVAARFALTSQAVSQWRQVKAERVIELAELTGWRVTPHEIRPDLYPYPHDGVPKAYRGRMRRRR